MPRYIDADALGARVERMWETRQLTNTKHKTFIELLNAEPTVEVVPWEVLERYADWFCAQVSYPEFVREARQFYESTYRAMDGGIISPAEGMDVRG